MTFSETIYKF